MSKEKSVSLSVAAFCAGVVLGMAAQFYKDIGNPRTIRFYKHQWEVCLDQVEKEMERLK